MFGKFGRKTILGVVALALSGIGLAGPVEAEEKIVLRGITPWVKEYYWTEPFFLFQEMVEERLGDRVEVKYLGANEVVPPFEQFEALRNNVVDVIMGAASYYTGQVPEAMAKTYAQRSPTKLRENGFYDLMREIHLEKGGVVYLANVGGAEGTAFRFFSNREITEPDFSGLRVRVTPVYLELVEALGGEPVTMAPPEVYTALERGVVHAYGWSYGGIRDFGWHEVTDYVIDHAFYTANTSILINADVWNDLPDDVKAELEEIAIELEARAEAFMVEHNKTIDAALDEAGIEFLTFSDEDAKNFHELAYDVVWSEFLDNHPDVGPRLQELSRK